MKKTLIVGLVLFCGIITYLSIAGEEVKEIRTEIEIAAPPEKVWSVLMDIDKWQEWSPIINQSSGTAALGSQVEITMSGKKKGTDGPKYSPKIIKYEESEIFQWRAHMISEFVFTNDKVFELEATATGTRLIHKELFSGMLSPIFCGKRVEEGVPPMLNSMNKALKELIESQ